MVVNDLYYAKPEIAPAPTSVSVRRGFAASAVSEPLAIDDDIIAAALRSIYKRDFDLHADVEPHLFRELAATFTDAATRGAAPALGRDPMLDALRHSGDVFAAFKTHRAQSDMAARLLDSNGNLKPFEQWKSEVMPIASHQCGAWLETEYNTAVIRARQAAQWEQFEREKDVLPNLKWLPSTSPNPGKDHQPFWNTVLPIDHPFWSQHRPGDRWNCKCSLTSTDEPPTSVPSDSPAGNNPQPGLKDNPGKSGALIDDDHPYFPKDCNSCPFYKPSFNARLRALFMGQVKDCYHCPYVDGCVDRAREVAGSADVPRHTEPLADNEAIKKSREEVREYFMDLLKGGSHDIPVNNGPIEKISLTYQGVKNMTGKPHKFAKMRNELCYNISDAMLDAEYLGWSRDIKGPGKAGHGDGQFIWHYYKIFINNEESYVIVRENGTNKIFHAIQDSDHFKPEKIQNPQRKR